MVFSPDLSLRPVLCRLLLRLLQVSVREADYDTSLARGDVSAPGMNPVVGATQWATRQEGEF